MTIQVNKAISDRPDRGSTEQIISLFEKNSPALEMQEAFDRVRPEINRLRSGKCTLVVIGEIKKGKSSLINALLGITNVLPVSSDVATATVFRVVYGQKRRNVVVLRSKPVSDNTLDYSAITADAISMEFNRMANQKIILTEREVTDEELFLYGAEDGNPENEKGVDHIRIEIPCEALRNGLEIIDTPGLGGLMKAHADITWGYIPNAQAVLFVLESVESPFTKDEHLFLSRIKTITPRIIFAQTKIDKVDDTKWKSWRERNLEEISKVLGIPKEQIPYFPVSSEDKQIFLEDGDPEDFESSGFGHLENFIFNRLLKLYELALCQNVLGRLDLAASEKEKEIRASQKIVNTDEAKLADMQAHYTARQKEFSEFEAEEFPLLTTRLQDRLQDIIAAGEKELNEFLQPNQYNPVVDEFINNIRELNESPKAIQKKINEMTSFFTDTCGKQTHEIYTKHRQKITGFIYEEFKNLENRLQEICISPEKITNQNEGQTESAIKSLSLNEQIGNDMPAIRQQYVDVRLSDFDFFRNVFMGGSFGGTVGYAALSVMAPVIVINPIVLPFAFIIGAFCATRNVKHQQRQQIIGHFQKALPGILLQLQKSYASQYKEVMNEVNRKVRDEQRMLAKTMKQQINDRLREISELRKNEGLSVEQRKKKLAKDLNLIINLRESVSRAYGNVKG